MKYEFDMKCFHHQGIQFTFKKRPGYLNLIIGLAVLFLTQFMLEKVTW